MFSRRTFGPIQRGRWVAWAATQSEGRIRVAPVVPHLLWSPPMDGWPFMGGEPLRGLGRLVMGTEVREGMVREGVFGEVQF